MLTQVVDGHLEFGVIQIVAVEMNEWWQQMLMILMIFLHCCCGRGLSLEDEHVGLLIGHHG